MPPERPFCPLVQQTKDLKNRLEKTARCKIPLSLINKLTVLVLPEQTCPNHWQCVSLEKLQAFIQGIINVNFSPGSHNRYPTGPWRFNTISHSKRGEETYDPSGWGFFSSSSISISFFVFSLYSFLASPIAFLTTS